MSKVVGAIRTIDALGRIVIPSEIRYALEWNEKDSISIVMDKNSIVMEKYNPKDVEEKLKVVEGLKIISDNLTESEKTIVKRAIKFMDKY